MPGPRCVGPGGAVKTTRYGQIQCTAVCCPKVPRLGSGPRTHLLTSAVPGEPSPVGPMGTALCTTPTGYAGPCLCRFRGVNAGQGSTAVGAGGGKMGHRDEDAKKKCTKARKNVRCNNKNPSSSTQVAKSAQNATKAEGHGGPKKKKKKVKNCNKKAAPPFTMQCNQNAFASPCAHGGAQKKRGQGLQINWQHHQRSCISYHTTTRAQPPSRQWRCAWAFRGPTAIPNDSCNWAHHKRCHVGVFNEGCSSSTAIGRSDDCKWVLNEASLTPWCHAIVQF